MSDPILAFHGAARAVTGSCFRLTTAKGSVLIDCGMFQGAKTEKSLNWRAFPFDPAGISAVLLTHAHIDHSGLLPKLWRDGFRGRIHATAPTAALCGIMLPDSAHIQEMEVEQLNRRNRRDGKAEVEPIYGSTDADAVLRLFHPVSLGDWVQVLPDLRARYWNAGHMLGSASIEVEVALGDGVRRILFSGDLGPDAKLLQRDPEGPQGVDYVIVESTYGDTDRIDASAPNRRATLAAEVRRAMDRAGNAPGALLIPTFAVERAQELIADLTQLMEAGDLPWLPMHVDSPLAMKATQVFMDHLRALDTDQHLKAGLTSHHLRFAETPEQSKAIDRGAGFRIVLAASGMCEAGRIRHHLKSWLWQDSATVLLCGYQAEGTLGRILQGGAEAVRIQGEEFPVRAAIRSIDLYSGHADGPELAQWLRERLPIRAGCFLVHGEEEAMSGLAARLDMIPDDRVFSPALDEVWRLAASGPVRMAEAAPPRLAPEQVARLDWHNDVSSLILDINAALRAVPDERARAVLIRRLRRALEDEGHPPPPPRHPHARRHS